MQLASGQQGFAKGHARDGLGANQEMGLANLGLGAAVLLAQSWTELGQNLGHQKNMGLEPTKVNKIK